MEIKNKEEVYKEIGERLLELYKTVGYYGISKTNVHLIVVDELFKALSNNEDGNDLNPYLLSNREVIEKLSNILKVDRNTVKNLLKKSYNMWKNENSEIDSKKLLINLISDIENQEQSKIEVEKTGKITIVVDNKVLREELENLFYKNGIYADYSFNKDLLKIDLRHMVKIYSKELEEEKDNLGNSILKILEKDENDEIVKKARDKINEKTLKEFISELPEFIAENGVSLNSGIKIIANLAGILKHRFF